MPSTRARGALGPVLVHPDGGAGHRARADAVDAAAPELGAEAPPVARAYPPGDPPAIAAAPLDQEQPPARRRLEAACQRERPRQGEAGPASTPTRRARRRRLELRSGDSGEGGPAVAQAEPRTNGRSGDKPGARAAVDAGANYARRCAALEHLDLPEAAGRVAAQA